MTTQIAQQTPTNGPQHGSLSPAGNPTLVSQALAAIEVTNHLQVFKAGTPSLALIKKDEGKELAQAFLMVALKELDDFYNLGEKGLNPQQVESLSRLILANFYYLTLADLRLFVDQFRLGQLADPGKPAIYGRLDGGTIMAALNKYVGQRHDEAEANSQRQASQHKAQAAQALGATGPDGVTTVAERIAAIALAWEEKPDRQAWKIRPIFLTLEAYASFAGRPLLDVQQEVRALAEAAYMDGGYNVPFENYLTFEFTPNWLMGKTQEAEQQAA